MGEIHINNILLSFEASSRDRFSETAARRGGDEALRHWLVCGASLGRLERNPAPSTVDPPKSPDRIEYLRPDIEGSCSMRAYRTVTVKGSTYLLAFNGVSTTIRTWSD